MLNLFLVPSGNEPFSHRLRTLTSSTFLESASREYIVLPEEHFEGPAVVHAEDLGSNHEPSSLMCCIRGNL
nr:hypothetical protein Iba_chr08aCG2040 [Ipomoea batatas]